MTVIKIKFSAAGSRPASFSGFMEDQILIMRNKGKERTSESYSSALNSIRRFMKARDIAFCRIDASQMIEYEAYLRNNGICPNTISFYMRSLRAVYNRAVEQGLTGQRHPFKHVYTGIGKTVKRAVPIRIMRTIKEMDLHDEHALEFARDMFMFSFYTRGMSLVDMAYLKKTDLKNGLLSYRRRKTGQQLFIKWESCMASIVMKYNIPDSPYLLPLIKYRNSAERRQYINAGHTINSRLKIIGARMGMTVPLTMYVARHSWASIARCRNVPLTVISEGMGHNSEKTTRIYLSSIDNSEVDKANRIVMKSLLP